MADIVSKINIGTSYAIRSGYTYGVDNTTLYSNNSTDGYVYSGSIKDSNGTTIELGSLYDGLTFYIRFHTTPLSDTVKLKLNGFGNKEIKYGNMESPRYKITPGAVYALRYTVINDVGYFIMVHSADTDTHYISTDVLAKTSGGTVNSTTDTANTTTYLNHVENGSVRSSLQIIGSGSTSVSAKNGVLTIKSVGGGDSSTDEKLTVSTYNGSEYKQVVLHDGGGSNGEGYGSNYFKFGLRTTVQGGEGYMLSTKTYNDLVLGRISVDSGSFNVTNDTNRGSITLGRGHGTPSSEIYGRLIAPSSGQYENELPELGGKLLSSGGLLIGTPNVNNEVQEVTYYKCLYKNGYIYSAGVASGQTVGDGNDYPEKAEWIGGSEYGPRLKFGSVTTNYPGFESDMIPKATDSNSGVVIVGEQYFGGTKIITGNLSSEQNICAGYGGFNEPGCGDIVGGTLNLYNGEELILTSLPSISTSFITLNYFIGADNYVASISTIPAIIKRYYGLSGDASQFKYYLPSTYSWNGSTMTRDEDGVIGIITNIGTPTGLVGIKNGNYLTTNNLAFGNDATKYLDNTGHWSVPAGGGGGGGSIGIGTNAGYNVFAASNIGTTNATVSSNINSVYLNHIDASGVVVSSNKIQGDNMTTVSANNGVLTITTPPTELTKGDFSTIGALIGFLGDSKDSNILAVQPARPDLAVPPKSGVDVYYTRQGVIKPMFETRGAIADFHDVSYGGSVNQEILTVENVIAANGFKHNYNYIAIPIVTDYWYNPHTERYESVPYVLIPSELYDKNDVQITDYYALTTFDNNNSEPSDYSGTHYPFDETYNGNLVDGRIQSE